MTMRIEYTGRHLEVPQSARRLAEQKLRKLERILPGITTAHVTLSADRHERVAEIVVHSPQLDLTAAEAGGDASRALKAALAKLLHQAQHAKGRRRDRQRHGAAAPRKAPATPQPAAERDVRIVRSRGFVAKPMTLDEALLQMETRKEGPLVFREPGAPGVRVLFWRRDGNLGLIDSEA
jgi:putative sigma-54 modulation protein